MFFVYEYSICEQLTETITAKQHKSRIPIHRTAGLVFSGPGAVDEELGSVAAS